MPNDGNVPSGITRRTATRTAALLAVPAAAQSARSGSGQIDVPGARSGEFSKAFTADGWGWSAYVVGNYLLRLYPLVHDASHRRGIEEKCVRAMQWCFDRCQYEDGAHGMFERDDK